MAAETLKALIETWRASEDHIRRNHPGDPLRLDPDTLSDCADELEAVLALCESPAAETWQPIATAPRDGTQIWAWDNERGANPAIWIPFKPVVDGDDGGTWVITYDDADIKPTLWRSLPSPPTSGAAQETNS